MKARAVEVTVGLFVIAGIVSLLILALQVSGLTHLFAEESGYKVKAEFTNLGGLKVRAKVSLAGVTVGRVTDIALEPESFYATVTLSIDPNRVQNLPEDTRASIFTSGLLGDNYISLTPGFSANTLKEGSMILAENTDSAIVLEQLVSQFLAGQATKKGDSVDEVKSPMQTLPKSTGEK